MQTINTTFEILGYVMLLLLIIGLIKPKAYNKLGRPAIQITKSLRIDNLVIFGSLLLILCVLTALTDRSTISTIATAVKESSVSVHAATVSTTKATTQTTTKTTPAPTPKQTPAATNTTSASPPVKVTPKPAAPSNARKVTGTAVTLGAGTFTGGQDVAVGLYDVTTSSGQSGNFIVNGTDSYNEILGDDGEGQGVPKIRVQIADGDQIQISSLTSVTFTPVTAAYVTTHTTAALYAGTFTVGQDIGAGRYVATPGAGQSGNFIVRGNDEYNEILGSDSSLGEVPSLTVTLTDGDAIDISGLSQVTLTTSN